MAGSKDKIWLSHSGIDVLYRCPRCFWLKYNMKIVQPEGIVSRLPGRFDIILKKYFDLFRAKKELPPVLSGKVEGILQSPFQEKYFYSINDKFGFWGKLDECLVLPGNRHSVVDFKTASSNPEGKEIFPAYQNQLDEFSFLLEANGKKTSGEGFLIYLYPKESEALHDGFPMAWHIQKIKTNPDCVPKRLKTAMEILDGSLPKSSENCPFCQWRDYLNKTLKEN